jgi:hypothetical protein
VSSKFEFIDGEKANYKIGDGRAQGVLVPMEAPRHLRVLASPVTLQEPSRRRVIGIRRFDSEAERVALYTAVYESDTWKEEIAPRTPEMLDRDKIVVTRLAPTPKSVIA